MEFSYNAGGVRKARTGDMYVCTFYLPSVGAFLQINLRIQVVIPTRAGAKILFHQRATVSRPIIFIQFLHGYAKRRVYRRFPRTRISLSILTSCLCSPRATPGSATAFLLNIQLNALADWLLIIDVTSRTRITINFVYRMFASATHRFSRRFDRRSTKDVVS